MGMIGVRPPQGQSQIPDVTWGISKLPSASSQAPRVKNILPSVINGNVLASDRWRSHVS